MRGRAAWLLPLPLGRGEGWGEGNFQLHPLGLAGCGLILSILNVADRLIGLGSERRERLEERVALAPEQSRSCQELDRTHGSTFGFGRPDDRTDRELAVEEYRRLRHDQVCLKLLPSEGRRVQIGKDQPVGRVGQWWGIARFVVPGLEVHGLGWADAQQNPQHLGMGDSLCQRWIKAGAALFDHGEVKARRVSDCLEMDGIRKIGIGSWNRWELPRYQTGNGLREGIAKIRVFVITPVAGPPTGVHAELHEVGKPADLLRAGRRAARQRAKPVQIHRLHAVCNQVRIDEFEVAEFVVRVVVNVLVHILIQHCQRGRVSRISGPTGHLGVLDAAEFIILLPQIGLEDFRGSQESQDGGVTIGDVLFAFVVILFAFVAIFLAFIAR